MVDPYYYLGSDTAKESVVYLSVVAAKAFATEYLRAPYHLPTVLADKDSPMLSVVPAGVPDADLVVLYNNYRPLWAGLSVAANRDSPMLSAKQAAVQDADLVVL